MARVAEDIADRACLDDLARIHDGRAVRHLGNHAHVVRHEDDAHAAAGLAAQAAQQVEDLGLDRHIERRGGLVGDEHGGAAGKRHGDHYALAHAAGHLVRIVGGAALGIGNADALKGIHGYRPRLAAALARVLLHGLGDLIAHRVERVQARHRLLEDHGDLVAAYRPHGGVVERGEIEDLSRAASQQDFACGDTAGRLDEPHQAEAGDRLAGPGFADDGQRLTTAQIQVDAINGTDGSALRVEPRLETLDADDFVRLKAVHRPRSHSGLHRTTSPAEPQAQILACYTISL